MIGESSYQNQTPLSFVTCVSSTERLRTNLLASPCLRPGTVHERVAVTHCPSAADGLNIGLERARHDWVVCVHEDVFLPEGWDRALAQQLREAEERFGPIGVAGVYGVGDVIGPAMPGQPLAAERIGWVIDRGRELRDGAELPARVATLDELVLVVRRDAGLRFDPGLGFHLYGADICLQAREQGLAVLAIGALCHHNSSSVGLPAAFHESAHVFAHKWRHRLPVATPCVIIDRAGDVRVLGNATAGPRSIARSIPNQMPARPRAKAVGLVVHFTNSGEVGAARGGTGFPYLAGLCEAGRGHRPRLQTKSSFLKRHHSGSGC